MRFRIPFPLVTTAGLLASIGILVVIASFAWTSLHNIVRELGEAAKPDQRLVIAKDIAFALTDAENSVQTFVVSPDSANLEPYFSGLATVDAKLDSLRKTSSSLREQVDVDTLNAIAWKKMDVLYDLLKLQKSAFIDSALQEIANSLHYRQENEVQPGASTMATKDKAATVSNPDKASEKEKNGIFKKIFGKKKKQGSPKAEDQDAVASSTVATNNSFDLKSIRKQLTQIREEDLEQNRLLQGQELALIQESQRLTVRLRSIISTIEQAELASRLEQTQKSEDTANSANTVIAVFSIAASLLLIVVGYSIFSFAKRSTEQRRMIQYAKEQAEQLAEDRERFVATMSHEIRTPMNAILGFSDQILQGDLPPSQRRNAEIVKDSSLHLLEVVNGVLDFTQLAAGKLKLSRMPFRLREETNFIIELLRQPAQTKGIALKLILDKDVPEVISGDPLRYRQILLNLLNNAIKFTEQGSVSLRVNVEEGQDSQALLIQVEDTGIGIAKEKLNAIFGEYEQASEDTKQRYGGTGLGLSITKMLLELQGGTIRASSEPGKGTTFHVSLPFGKATMADLGNPAAKKDFQASVPKGLKVLVADDEAYNRMLLVNMLKQWEAQCVEAADGEEALKYLLNQRFDLVLLDIRMPRMSGLELAKAIRADERPQLAGLPVIALTGGITEPEQKTCREMGILEVLIKPTTVAALAESIVAARATPSDPTPSIGDLRQLLSLAHGNVDFVEDLVQTYLNTLAQSLPEISTAASARNWGLIAEACHRLAPPTRHIEAIQFHHTLKSLEFAAKEGTDENLMLQLARKVDAEGKQVLNELRLAWDKMKRQ